MTRTGTRELVRGTWIGQARGRDRAGLRCAHGRRLQRAVYRVTYDNASVGR